jgi:hypothetical protein
MWYLLKTELAWSETNYNGMVPITTPEEQPEFANFTEPYIVYGYARGPNNKGWYVETEMAHFSIYSPDSRKINAALSMLASKLDRQDDAAKALNNFIYDPTNGLDDRYKDFDFKVVSVSSVEGPAPSAQEGGRRDGRLTVRMEYVRGILYTDAQTNPYIEYDSTKGY